MILIGKHFVDLRWNPVCYESARIIDKDKSQTNRAGSISKIVDINTILNKLNVDKRILIVEVL